jgi:hypothetical protein
MADHKDAWRDDCIGMIAAGTGQRRRIDDAFAAP